LLSEPDSAHNRRVLAGNPSIVLGSRAVAAADWISDRLDEFDPFEDRGLSPKRLKRFGELAYVTTYISEGPTDAEIDERIAEVRAKASAWQHAIVGHIERDLYREAPRKYPSLSYPLLFPYLMLRSSGYINDHHDVTIERLLHQGHFRDQEVLPHRFLEREFVLWKAGLSPEPDWEALYERTILARRGRLSFLDLGDMYSITHTLFYLLDMGRRALFVPPGEEARVVRVLDDLVVHSWRIGHWDLLYELLLCLSALGRSPACADVWADVVAAWEPAGAVGPANLVPAPEQPEFERLYHTTLVGLLLADTLARR
jgi:hypothetical protein